LSHLSEVVFNEIKSRPAVEQQEKNNYNRVLKAIIGLIALNRAGRRKQ